MNPTPVVAIAVLSLFAAAALAQGTRPPPPITHPIDGYLVTRAENNCLECHDNPKDIGKRRQKGANVPAPASHYGGKVEGKPEVVASHFICTTCHAKR